MLCNKCQKKEATCFIEKNINGKVTKLALCRDCAEKSDEFKFDPFDGLNMFNNFFGIPVKTLNNGVSEKRCTLCASTFEDLVNSGKVGCAECYKVFADELAPTIKRIHGARTHIGRRPRAVTPDSNSDNTENAVEDSKDDEKKILKQLKRDLSDAVKREEYEKAAELRDKIKNIENGQA